MSKYVVRAKEIWIDRSEDGFSSKMVLFSKQSKLWTHIQRLGVVRLLSFRLDHLLGKELFKNVIVRLISGAELTLNYFELKDKAVEIPLHEHPVEHLVIVLKGKVEFVMKDQKKVLEEREGLFLPAKTLHSATVIKAPVKALEIYASAEDEYYSESPKVPVK